MTVREALPWPSPNRIVCQNTLNAALSDMTQIVRIRHTANAEQRLRDAHKVMGLADTFFDQVDGIFNQWAKTPIGDKHVQKLIELAMDPNDRMWNTLKKGIGKACPPISRTAVRMSLPMPCQARPNRWRPQRVPCSGPTMPSRDITKTYGPIRPKMTR